MKPFTRTQDMLDKMTLDSFGGEVHQDMEVQIVWINGKLKAYAPKLECFLQFPRALRTHNATFICDASESQHGVTTFFRAYKGTIRDMDGNVVG